MQTAQFTVTPTKGFSAVAGILDQHGGLRVVVTELWRMRSHVGKGEQLFVVPGMEVQEPVHWNEVPRVIAATERHVIKSLAPTNHCGECRACCFFPKVEGINKPAEKWCPNCSQNYGCKIYWKRPEVCRKYVCGWLASQGRNDKMALELRPDKCGAIFLDDSTTNDPLVFEVHGKPNANAQVYIDEMQRLGYKARKVVKYIDDDQP